MEQGQSSYKRRGSYSSSSSSSSMSIAYPSEPGDYRSKKRKRCPFVTAGFKDIDFKDTNTLSKFITDRGKILPRRITGVSAYFQKRLSQAIKRARHMALLPFVGEV